MNVWMKVTVSWTIVRLTRAWCRVRLTRAWCRVRAHIYEFTELFQFTLYEKKKAKSKTSQKKS